MNKSDIGSKCSNNCCGGAEVITDKSDRQFTIALLGQPNTGKSTIFNKLTGANQHVGNWPGKTVEKKEGYFTHLEQKYYIYDLPGTYSLTSNSLEETISRDFILSESPDLVVVVVDASQLKRSLYMLSEAVLLGVPVVVVLNKVDMIAPSVAEKLPKQLTEATGIPVIPVSVFQRRGSENLAQSIAEAVHKNIEVKSMPDPEKYFGLPYSVLLKAVKDNCPAGYSPEWITIKLFEGDSKALELMQSEMDDVTFNELEDTLADVDKGAVKGASMRYGWIDDVLSETDIEKRGKTKMYRFDTITTHPFLGNIIALIALLFGMTGAYLIAMPLLLPGLGLLIAAKPIRGLMAPVLLEWAIALLADGILGGLSVGLIVIGFVGAVYFVLGIYENTGYLARLAYLFDPLMKRVGLHGKSIMPLLMGLVCNIIGVVGSRVMDTWQQRLVTLVVVPIIPCKGLLVLIGFIAVLFFGTKVLMVFTMLFVVMLVYIFFTSFMLRKFVVKGERSGLIMELPPYNKPVWRDIIRYTISRMRAFYRRGFWFVVLINFLCWVGIYYPDGTIGNSYLAAIGTFLEPVGQVMGLDWRLFVSYLIAFASKEAALPAMVVIFGADVITGGTNLYELSMDMSPFAIIVGSFGSFLTSAGVSPASALAFAFATSFSLPCLSTLGTIYSETKSYAWTMSVFCYYFAVSVFMGAAAYQVGRIMF